MAEANPVAAPGETAWSGKGGLAVRIQLCRSQPAPTAEADCATNTGSAQAAMCLNVSSGNGIVSPTSA